ALPICLCPPLLLHLFALSSALDRHFFDSASTPLRHRSNGRRSGVEAASEQSNRKAELGQKLVRRKGIVIYLLNTQNFCKVKLKPRETTSSTINFEKIK